MGLLNQLVNYYKCLKPIKINDYIKNCLIKIRLDKLEERPEVDIIDNLTEGGYNKALSAEQGKILGEGVFGKTTNTIYEPTADGCFVTSAVNIGRAFKPVINTSVTNCKAIKINVHSGEKYFIKGYGNTAAIALYVLCDSNDIVLVKHLEDARVVPT